MKQENKSLADFNDQELQQEVKKRKGIFIAFCFVIGLMIGVAIYNAANKGSFIFSCLPLFFMTVFISIERSYKGAKKELEVRGLGKK